MKQIVVTTTLAASLFLSASAFAAEPSAPDAPKAPAAGTEAKPDAKPADAPASGGGEEMRLRIGFNLGGGAVLGTGSGAALATGFRVGLQVNRLFGAYVQTGGNVLFASYGSGGATAIAFIPISPMASLTPIDQIEIAAGPSLDYYAGGTVSSTTAGGSTGSFAFGIAGRLALHLGGRNEQTGRRSGFAISADIHPIFAAGGSVVPLTLGLGGDWL